MITRQFGPSVGSHIEQGRPAGPPPNLSTTRLPHRRIVSPRTSPPFRTIRILPTPIHVPLKGIAVAYCPRPLSGKCASTRTPAIAVFVPDA
jgi:hypothetical protein